MLRDSSLSRLNSSSDLDEIENLPLNPNFSSYNLVLPNSSFRPLLHHILEPIQNSKLHANHDVTTSKPKVESTSIKSKGNIPSFLLPTPKRHCKNRVGFSSLNECCDEAMSEMRNYSGQSTRSHAASLDLTPRVSGRATSTQTTTKSIIKPPSPGYLYSSSRHPENSRVVNTVEVSHFDLKEDPSFWMDHNVQVIIRVRPLNGNERCMYGYNRCVRQESAQCITWTGQPETRFTFDHVACETVDQVILFRMAGLPMVEHCLSGYNSCMFAYGQTGSGKTYTMLGKMENVDFTPSSHRGLTPRIFESLFACIKAEEESRRDEKLKYSCKCSFLEIYNQQITDLLNPPSTNLLLREDVKKGVYVENLSEFEVHTAGDVLRYLIQGSSNRKVVATNKNRQSSRSHCVFICIIESMWERNSVTNYRFARLNLVDLAGSERQKSSGAEGERLKEAAIINKTLSTLGHVIKVLVDIAHGKTRHIPYRDSKLTFLLQDSLGGNSKTTIMANISPSVRCAAETLNTLKFAQRARFIQNNAVANEDSSGDIAVPQHQIWLLKEKLSALKLQNVSRTLAFDPSTSIRNQVNSEKEIRSERDQVNAESSLESESKGGVRVSPKQLKSLKMMLAEALRREQMAETSMKQLEAEIEQLNRLVRQREEDTRRTERMLKFSEVKIQRMESLLGELKPVDAYLFEENAAISGEIQILQAKDYWNPEVIRSAVENIRLLEELRRLQDFYDKGDRDLMNEVSDLPAQLIITSNELAEGQTKLKSCLETNSKLNREIEIRNKDLELRCCHDNLDAMKDLQVPLIPSQASDRVVDENRTKHGNVVTAEEVVILELEVDILNIILKEKLSRCEMEELASSLTRDVQKAEQQVFCISKQLKDAEADFVEAKSVIQALESQQLLSIAGIKDLKSSNSHHLELLCKQELQISALKEQASRPRLELQASLSAKNEEIYLSKKNMKSKQEIEICRLVKERLLSDMKSSFNRISSKEGETRELNLKLDNFKENLAVLQHQEELMLEMCNFMGSKLAMLEEELNQSNSTVAASLAEQDKLLKNTAKLIESQAEVFSIELYAKDLEVSFMTSELQQLAQHNSSMDKQQQICCTALDSLVTEIVTREIFADLREQLLLEKESEVDQQDQIEEMGGILDSTKCDLVTKSRELDQLRDELMILEGEQETGVMLLLGKMKPLW